MPQVLQEAPSLLKNYILKSGTIHWVGSKVAYDHNGTINVSEGKITANGHKIKSGEFTIDLNSFSNNDLKEDQEKKALFEGHLKSSDFFEVKNYPFAHFKISSVKEIEMDEANYSITGLLTLKAISKEVSFPALVVVKSDGTIEAISDKFVINRIDWGIKYPTSLKGTIADALIADNVKLQITLSAMEILKK